MSGITYSMRRRRLPRYVSEFADRHGKIRVRFRKKGHVDYYFKSVPWTEAFMREYRACLDGERAPRIEPDADRTKPGSISALVAAYYRSPGFLGLTPSTKKTYRGIIERFRSDHGEKPVAKLERRHVMAIVGARSKTPGAANNLLRMIRMLMRFAVDIGMRRDDPTAYMKGLRSKSTGFHSWTEDEIARFEARHPVGSKARLALELPLHPELEAILDQTLSENLTFLVTAQGKPFTAAGFGNWFRERCNEAGLKQCSAHGLRKAAARRLAEAGCRERQIMAVTGHRTAKEVSRYTREADQQQLADNAVRRMAATKEEQILANHDDRLAKKTPN